MGDAYMFITNMGDKIESELKKCDLLCKNCHARIHFNNEKFNSLKEKIFEKYE